MKSILIRTKKIFTELASPRGRPAIVAAAFMIFFAAFMFLRPVIGLPISMAGILPVLLGAWLYGKWLSFAFSIFLYSITALIVIFLGWGDVSSIARPSALFGLITTTAAGFLVGWMGDVVRKRQEEISQSNLLLEESQSHTRFLALLNDIMLAAMETDDMTTMLKVLAQQTGELFHADDCYITLWDEKNHKTTLAAAYGSSSETNTSVHRFMPEEITLTAAIMDAEHALAIEDMKHAPHVSPNVAEEFPNLSALGLPLISGARKLGAVILGYDNLHQFSKTEIQQGELAAWQISLAVTKAILLDEARQRVDELAGLHHISQAFSLHEDAHRTFGLLTGILAKLMKAELCVIGLYDPGTYEFRAQALAYGIQDELIPALHYPMRNQVWRPSQPGVFKANSVGEIPIEFMSLAHSFNVDSIIAAPLWDEEKHWIGAIFAANKPGGFDDNDIRLIEVFSSQVVIVIQNTQLLVAERKRAKQLSALHAIAMSATEADNEDDLIEHVTRLIGERLYPDSFGILLLDEGVSELYLHSSYRMGTHEGPIRVPLGIGITGVVARSGKPRRVDDTSQTSEYLSLYPLTRSELCIPLKVEEQVIGLINVESSKKYAFTDEDEELLTIIAGQLATAIQRLRTAQAEYQKTEQLKRSNSLIRALSQVNTRAAAVADLDGVIQTLGNELATLGMRCMVALTDSGHQNVNIQYISLPDRTIRALENILNFRIQYYLVPLEKLILDTNGENKAYIIQDLSGTIEHALPTLSRQVLAKIIHSAGIIETTSVCYLPLITEGRLVGIIWLWGEGIHESDLPTVSLFASQIAAVLQSARLLAEVRRLAITDELTGLYNRRHFFDLAKKAYAHAIENHLALSALIIDLDHFKLFNDRYGHIVGDKILHETAQLIKSALREHDIVGRYGGEEFSILLPGTNPQGAVKVAKRIITKVTAASIETEAGPLAVHLSIGAAALNKKTPDLYALINSADQAMYIAKTSGGDRVVSK